MSALTLRSAGRSLRRSLLLGCAGLALTAGALGCGIDNDACKGRTETCLSLSLSGSDGVTKADQVQVFVARKPTAANPVEALSEPRELPFKIAVLWPDGPATLHVRTFLDGQLNGLSPEISLDLRNGAHEKRKLTLYAPILGSPLPDMSGGVLPDMTTPRDMANPPDLADPPDLGTPPDMASPDMPAPDLGS